MEAVVKKYQQKFKKARDEMDRWDQLQSRLLSQFRNASAVIETLEVLQNTKNYGVLKSIAGIKEQMIGKQMMSLDTIIGSMKDTLKEFHAIVLSLERNIRDGRQLVKGGSKPLSQNQMQLGIGIQPSIADCLEGLRLIHEMYHHDASELGSLQQFLADQPNIPKEEVQSIFDKIFAEEIC